MAYFNHAFNMVFVGTHDSQNASNGVRAGVDQGFLTDDGISVAELNNTASPYQLGVGTFGMFLPDTWLSVDTAGLSNLQCCPLVLASSSIFTNDKIGPMAGGYRETVKSKKINPKYVQKFYRVDPCAPTQNIVHIGNTPYTDSGLLTVTIAAGGTGYNNGTFTNVSLTGGTNGTGALGTVTVAGGIVTSIVVTSGGINYAVGEDITVDPAVIGAGNAGLNVDAATISTAGAGNCCRTFLCNESYTLRIDVKGSPVLRYLSRNGYWSPAKWTGCCEDPTIAPVAVDSTLVFISWADQLIEANNKIVGPFLQIVVFDEAGNPWYAPGTTGGVDTWDNYVSAGHTAGACAGMRITGAYVDTKFGDCTFYPSDFFEKEPVHIYASLMDETGDPCEFEDLCVITQCQPRQGMGFGEQVVRDLSLSESYRQNYMSTNMDLRIREITQGYDFTNVINRSSLYYRYYILHSVPRYNNPSGTFDNDRYLLEIITDAPSTAFETFMNTWLGNCNGDCAGMETISCQVVCS